MLVISHNNFRILFVCTTLEWGARERLALRFFLEAHSNGHEPQLIVSKDSNLAHKCHSMGFGERLIEIPPSETDFFSLLARIPRYRRILQTDRSHLVFTFSLRDALVWSWVLRSYSAKALCLFINHEIVNSYRKIWLRRLVSRIDHIFLSSEEIIENIWAHLKVPSRKCSTMLPFSGNYTSVIKSTELERKSFTIGLYLSPAMRDQAEIQKVFIMLKNLKEELKDKYLLSVKLFTDQDLPKTYLSDNMNRLIELLGGLEHLATQKFNHLKIDFSQVDIWFSPFIQEELEDFALLALVNGLPIATPRTAVHMNLLKRFQGVGVSFKASDAREMRTKLKELVFNYKAYKQDLSRTSAEIHEEFIQKNGLMSNWGFLQRIVNRRNRYALSRER